MALGGGTFNAMNKTLPGAYINFVSAGSNVTLGERGTAILALPLNWGAEGEFIKIEAGEFTAKSRELLGYDVNAAEILAVRECMKRAKTLLLWRADKNGVKASATVGDLTVTAKYSGTRGNALSVGVYAAMEDMFEVITYLDGDIVDKQTVATASELVPNEYVAFGGEALLQDERITDVDEFTFERSERNTLNVSFTVRTIFGDIENEIEVRT